MVIVVYHALVATYLRLKRESKGNKKRNDEEISNVMLPESVQEAVVKLCELDSASRIETVVKHAVSLVLPSSSGVVVYVLSSEGELVSTQGLTHVIPKEGIASKVLHERQRVQIEDIDLADPLTGLFEGQGYSLKSKLVLCSPVIDKDTEKIILVYVALCDELTREEENHLSLLERQICACYKRLHQPMKKTSDRAVNIVVNSKSQADKILELCAELYDHDAATLQLKVIKFLQEQTDAENSFLLLVAYDTQELICQVVGTNVLEPELRFGMEGSSFMQAIQHKIPLILEELEENQRKEITGLLGHEMHSFLCVPVCSRVTSEVMALACMINKRGAERFYEQDVQKIQHCFQYTSPVLSSAIAVQSERRLKNQTQALLQVARNLFTRLDDLTSLLREIMQEARNLTKAERCSVFLLEKETNELVARVFDGGVKDNNQLQAEVRIPANQGIAGHVATTGKMLNIRDAYAHPLFYRGVDTSTGFKTRNILCFPLKNDEGMIVGVAQLCNKLNAPQFTAYDEEAAEAFAVYCCISITHGLLYRKVRDAQHKSKLSNELMIYHMQVAPDDVTRLSKIAIPAIKHFGADFDKIHFTPRSISDFETPMAVLSMFEDMGFISKFKIRRDTLAKFVLMVKKGYRDPPYHNWAHAFSVGHFCYLLYKNVHLLNYLEDIEIYALFVACLCHDIDHRGTTNSYQVTSGSVLAALYSSEGSVMEESVLAALYSSEGSVMERHHFSQTMCILNTEGCNIFDNLSRHHYERSLDLLRDIILATDLAHHLRVLGDIEKMVKDGYDRNDPKHRQLLLCLLMTSCDLSDQTKNWHNSKKIAELIYGEFFSQGDLERAIGHNPAEMMDRERACIPDLQIGFLDNIAHPVYKVLTDMFPDAVDVLRAVENNRSKWGWINDKLKNGSLSLNSAVDVFNVEVCEEDIT